MSLKCRWQLYGFSILSFLSLLATEPSDSPQSALGLFHGYTTALGVRGTLKPPDVVTDEVKQILKGVNIPTSCPLEVDELNSACVECQDPNYIYCNITESLITEDLDGLDQINFLRIDTESLHQIKSRFFGELDVKTLDIRYTGLLSLDFDLFSGIQNLRTLIIRSPSTVVIQRSNPNFVFTGLENLTSLFLENNLKWDVNTTGKEIIFPNLKVFVLRSDSHLFISPDTFKWLRKSPVTHLYIQNTFFNVNKCQEILEPLQSTLTFLDASGSTFEDNSHPTQEQPLPNILEKLMIGLQSKENNSTSIQGLSFANSQLTSIPYKALYIVRGSLQYLSLSRNNIDTLSMRDNMSNLNGEANQTININDANETQLMFPFMPKLLELDLSDCALYALSHSIFVNFPNLEILILSRNKIMSINQSFFENLSKLLYVDFSNNELKKMNEIDINNINFPPSIEILDFSNVKLKRIWNLKGLGKNLKKLSLFNTVKTMKYIHPNVLQNLTGLEVLDLSGNKNIDQYIPNGQFEGLGSLKELYLNNCNIQNISTNNQSDHIESNAHPFESLISLRFIDMSSNALSILKSDNFKHLKNLERLNLNSNKIVSWLSSVISENTNLKELDLGNNLISSITIAMIQDLANLEQVYMHDNPYSCDCDVINFVEFINESKSHNLTIPFIEWSDNIYNCIDRKLSYYIPFTEYQDSSCIIESISSKESTFIIYAVLAILVTVLTIFGIIYWKWWNIKYFAHIVKDATILSFMDDERSTTTKDRVFKYDIFVSYSDCNREWVLDELLPNLENDSNLKVCLHERDFQVGLSILENIIASMDQSRFILLVISPSFLQSQWCQFELHLAQHRLLETKREELILVLLEEIPRCKRSKMLHYLMRTKTYIVWPKQHNDMQTKNFFWKRLRQAIVLSPELHTNESSSFA